jgi:epsilon-lactone hydrolase
MSVLPPAVLRPGVRVAGRWIFSPRASWPTRRERADLVLAIPGAPRGTRIERALCGGVGGERLIPPGVDPAGGTLLYLHGGGYAVGSPRAYRGLAARLARAVGIRAVVPDYRLAPEHPHPAAVEDTVSAYEALLEEGVDPGRIVVAGDSAGGGLALALALSLRDAGRPLPAVLGPICPWVDLRPDSIGPGRDPAPREPILTRGVVRAFARAYLSGGASPDDPLVSPVLADLHGLPPIVLHSCGDDLLARDARALEQAATAAGLAVEHRSLPDLWHDAHFQAWAMSGVGDPVGELGESLRARLRG